MYKYCKDCDALDYRPDPPFEDDYVCEDCQNRPGVGWVILPAAFAGAVIWAGIVFWFLTRT